MIKFFLAWVFLPPLLMVTFSQGSLAVGMTTVAIFFILLSVMFLRPLRISSSYLLLLFLCGVWTVIAIDHSSIEKQLASLAAATICSISVTTRLSGQQAEIGNAITTVFWTLTVVGILGVLLPLSPGKYAFLNSPVFPFSEPSHFSLAYSPFLCAALLFQTRKIRFLILSISIGLSLSIPNLTLLIISILIAAITLSLKQLLIGALFLTPLIFLSMSQTQELFEYFSSRIGTGSDMNLSRLAYIQGWEIVSSAIIFSNGLGVGYQNLGIEPPGESTLLIQTISNSALNRSDGGFVLAKFGGEFGIIGVGLVCLASFVSIISGIRLREALKDGKILHNATSLVPLCFTYMASVEFFIRGTGYFSPTLFISLFFLPKSIQIIFCDGHRAFRFHNRTSNLHRL